MRPNRLTRSSRTGVIRLSTASPTSTVTLAFTGKFSWPTASMRSRMEARPGRVTGLNCPFGKPSKLVLCTTQSLPLGATTATRPTIPEARPLFWTFNSIASLFASTLEVIRGRNPLALHCQPVRNRPTSPITAVETAPTQSVMLGGGGLIGITRARRCKQDHFVRLSPRRVRSFHSPANTSRVPEACSVRCQRSQQLADLSTER